MPIVRLLQRGQLTLPKAIRDEAGVAEDDDLLVYVSGRGRIVLDVLPRPKSLEEMLGSAPPVKPLDVVDAVRQARVARAKRGVRHNPSEGAGG